MKQRSYLEMVANKLRRKSLDTNRFNSKYGPIVRAMLMELKNERRLSEAARKARLPRSRLSEILSGSRSVTPYYLSRLIGGKVLSIEAVLRGKDVDSIEDAEERLFFLRQRMDDELVQLVHDVGEDKVRAMLKIMKEKA